MDVEALKERTKIYSLDPKDKLYNYHKAINDARYQLAGENPMLIWDSSKLTKLAVAKLDADGYNYSKKKSRSKQLNPESSETKRMKMDSNYRARRVTEATDDLKEVEKQLELCNKQRERYSNCQQYNSALSMSDKIDTLCQKKRKLQTELTMLEQKESNSQRYYKGKKNKRVMGSATSSTSTSELSKVSSSTPQKGSLVKTTAAKITQFFDKVEDEKATGTDVLIVKDDARPSEESMAKDQAPLLTDGDSKDAEAMIVGEEESFLC